jgi:hypothetical protein
LQKPYVRIELPRKVKLLFVSMLRDAVWHRQFGRGRDSNVTDSTANNG